MLSSIPMIALYQRRRTVHSLLYKKIYPLPLASSSPLPQKHKLPSKSEKKKRKNVPRTTKMGILHTKIVYTPPPPKWTAVTDTLPVAPSLSPPVPVYPPSPATPPVIWGQQLAPPSPSASVGILALRYPDGRIVPMVDARTGAYVPGDVRGWVWVPSFKVWVWR